MIPSVVTTETLQKEQKPIVEFRGFDPNTGKSFSHVTYNIIIEKDGVTWFHADNGDLGIKIEPNRTSKTIAVAEKQDFFTGPYLGSQRIQRLYQVQSF
jgi:hypothetical protein